MPLRKAMRGIPQEPLPAEGLMHHDPEALTDWQRECTARLAMTYQLEHEAYLTQHPEIFAMLELFISQQVTKRKRIASIIKEAGEFFLQPFEEFDNIIRKRLGVGPGEPYVKEDQKTFNVYDDIKLETDLKAIILKHLPPKPWSLSTPSESLRKTESSSFISFLTSDTTLPTPVPSPIPTPTLSEHFMTMISNTVDKAIFTRFDDQAVYYDAAYVAVSKAVEAAMEIPVAEIKEDIIQMYNRAFAMFEGIMEEKKRVAAEIAWEKRMRKKMKKTVRREMNFKGYESPPSPGYSVSSHESHRHAPPRPCACHPQWHYNRYPKDRFGIYLPTEPAQPKHNMTVTPVISLENLEELRDEDEEDLARSTSSIGGSSKTSRTSRCLLCARLGGDTAVPPDNMHIGDTS
ncbi:hypothetical protein NE865_06418 [Phthorimaea operculella]|nr:hypothetical protein NE865_06418 [Phthorimaea operculella]